MIEVQHLTKRYGRVTAVDDVSFRVESGEILGFLGPNGAGKTTTMRILTGYMPASEGRATVAGYDVFTHPMEAKRRTGYLPETPPLYPDMTVREYLDFVARIKGVPSAERKSRVDTVMKRTHVDDMAARHCGKLSKGYRQRVGLAQTIIHNPEVLILDEPTAGLDPKQIIETRELIRSLAGDHTIILSTHILPEVSQTCQRVVIINKGRVVAVDTPENLTSRLSSAGTLYVQVDAAGADVGTALATVPGVSRVVPADQRPGSGAFEVESERGRDVRRELSREIVSRGWGLLELRPMRLSLEEVFLQVTTEETPGDAPAAPVHAEEAPVRNILAIADKELRSYFASPIAYILIGFFLLPFGAFFYLYLTAFVKQSLQQAQFGGAMNINQSVIRYVLQNASVIILFIMPMITMRTYSEEKRSGTIELLLTSPVTDVEIILGKFFGALGLYAAMLSVTLIYIGILFVYGNPEWRPVVAAYLGLLLMGGTFVSLGLLISSTTSNQIVAGVVTFVVFLLLWIIGWFADTAGPTIGPITSWLSITEHFDDFSKGIIDTKHVLYYLSLITFGLFLTAKSVDTERWRG